MNMTGTTCIVSQVIKEHIPAGTTLLDLAKQSDKYPWLVEVIADVTSFRQGATGFDGKPCQIAVGNFAVTTLPPFATGNIEAEQLILPARVGQWLAARVEKKGNVTGVIKVGVRVAKRSPSGYAWTGDFDDASANDSAANTQQEDAAY